MMTRIIPMSLFANALIAAMALSAEPIISNMHATQVAGTKLVEIRYDLSGGTPPYSVSVQGSADSGATWALPMTTMSGYLGAGVSPGLARKITWNAGQDWNGQFSQAVRFRIAVLDVTDAPNGFSLIPAGVFTMGRTSGDTDSDAPPVTVNVSAFYMGKYEVTKALWDEVRVWGAANGYTDLRSGGGKAPNHPVHSISWYDMVKWCNARSQKDGLTPVYTVSGTAMKTGTSTPTANWSANGYRLPTEAEWEKAARGGVSGKRFPWGTDTISHSQANYRAWTSYSYDSSGAVNNYHPTYATDSFPYSSPVGSFAPNGYGLYDMAGNMWEWCWDWYGALTYVSGSSDPKGAASGTYRVIRGCSWTNVGGAFSCRAAFRSYLPASTTTSYDFGFRMARSAVP